MATATTHVHVKWAQRKDKLLITFEVVDAQDVKVSVDDQSVTVEGRGKCVGTGEGTFSRTLNLLNTVDPAKSSYKDHASCIQLCAIKAESGPHWGRLVQEPSKATKNWLSCDWGMWKDEDEENDDEKMEFGGYGDLKHMIGSGGANNKGSSAAEATEEFGDSDEEEDEGDIDKPAADLSDLDK